MEKSFLEYYKEILEKVSFDSHLLKKEYQKAIKSLDQSELQQFDAWIKERGISSALAQIDRPQDHLFRK